jgi:hypothetical protein
VVRHTELARLRPRLASATAAIDTSNTQKRSRDDDVIDDSLRLRSKRHVSNAIRATNGASDTKKGRKDKGQSSNLLVSGSVDQSSSSRANDERKWASTRKRKSTLAKSSSAVPASSSNETSTSINETQKKKKTGSFTSDVVSTSSSFVEEAKPSEDRAARFSARQAAKQAMETPKPAKRISPSTSKVAKKQTIAALNPQVNDALDDEIRREEDLLKQQEAELLKRQRLNELRNKSSLLMAKINADDSRGTVGPTSSSSSSSNSNSISSIRSSSSGSNNGNTGLRLINPIQSQKVDSMDSSIVSRPNSDTAVVGTEAVMMKGVVDYMKQSTDAMCANITASFEGVRFQQQQIQRGMQNLSYTQEAQGRQIAQMNQFIMQAARHCSTSRWNSERVCDSLCTHYGTAAHEYVSVPSDCYESIKSVSGSKHEQQLRVRFTVYWHSTYSQQQFTFRWTTLCNAV